MSPLLRWSVCILGMLSSAACSSEDDSRYREVAQGRYTEVWQSVDLEGRVCPDGAAEADRQIDELASALRVSVPEDFRVIARIEPGNDAVKEACGNDEVSACLLFANADGSPLMISPQYLWGHEVVHAVQSLRPARPHAALREGEARMFQDPADTIATLDFCGPRRLDESTIREALDDPLGPGNYSVFHEMVARVYQDYGPEAFDALWAASAENRSTEALVSAFESVLGTTLFALMQRPSPTCRDRIPGCAGLERLVVPADGLTITTAETCGPGVTGLDTSEIETEHPGRLVRNFVVELPGAGELTVSFTGSGWGSVQVAACDGWDSEHDYGYYSSIDDDFGSEPRRFALEAGLHRAIVVGSAEGLPAQAHFLFEPGG